MCNYIAFIENLQFVYVYSAADLGYSYIICVHDELCDVSSLADLWQNSCC